MVRVSQSLRTPTGTLVAKKQFNAQTAIRCPASVLNEHDFAKWANSRHLQESITTSLKQAAAHAGDDTPVGRVVLDYAEIKDPTDDAVIDACAFDACESAGI